jgi:ubiquitin C-terminal hydrolase
MQGLFNLGFTCAINSLIQIICRNDLMRNAVLNCDLGDDTLISNLKEVIILMYINNNTVSPKKFVANIYSKFEGIFIYGEQLDITELWIFMNEKIIEELNGSPNHHNLLLDYDNIDAKYKVLNGITYDDYNSYMRALKNSKYLNEKYIYHYVTHSKNKISMWQSTTEGFLLNITKCKKCNYTLYDFEPICALHMNIPENIENPTIVHMLQELLIENNYSNDWNCDNCKEKTDYIKTSKIWSLPDVLFIIINRFINPNIKNTKPIYINDALCFNTGTILSHADIEKNYKLSSVALHVGNATSGHYMSICSTQINEKGDNTFLLYNDEQILNAGDFLQNNSDAYMLVYNAITS